MASHRCKETFQLIFFFVLIFSCSMIFARESRAQCVAGDSCSIDADCGADGNICNGDEVCGTCGSDVSFPCCFCGAPPPSTTVCPSDGSFCSGPEHCDGVSQCVGDGDPCVGGSQCNSDCNDTGTDVGNCFDPNGTSCTDSDNIFCTSGACNGAGACIPGPNDFLCDDGVNCTVNDVCAGGVCAGSAIQCDDAITCTVDACEETSGLCQFDTGQCECQTDTDCNDNNVCTDEFCCTDKSCAPNDIFTCIRSNNTGPCDDGFFCNGTDVCAGGTCSVHSGDPCTGGGQCDQTCDENGDNCFASTGVACDDGDILTVTQCDGGGKCATVETFSTQGSTLGCSLQIGGENPTNAAASLVIAFALGMTWALFKLFAK